MSTQGTRNSGRVAGLLESEIHSGAMTLGEAELTAALGYDLDGDELDDCVARLRVFANELAGVTMV